MHRPLPTSTEFLCIHIHADPLEIEHPIHSRRVLRLQQRNRYVVYRYTAAGMTVWFPVMSMPVQHQIGAMTVDYLRQP